MGGAWKPVEISIVCTKPVRPFRNEPFPSADAETPCGGAIDAGVVGQIWTGAFLPLVFRVTCSNSQPYLEHDRCDDAIVAHVKFAHWRRMWCLAQGA
jgi:hypothetical protein